MKSFGFTARRMPLRQCSFGSASGTAAADGLIANWTLGDLGSPGTAGTPG